jgi:hypothetical protein
MEGGVSRLRPNTPHPLMGRKKGRFGPLESMRSRLSKPSPSAMPCHALPCLAMPEARHGMARHGKAWQGKADTEACLRSVKRCTAWEIQKGKALIGSRPGGMTRFARNECGCGASVTGQREPTWCPPIGFGKVEVLPLRRDGPSFYTVVALPSYKERSLLR